MICQSRIDWNAIVYEVGFHEVCKIRSALGNTCSCCGPNIVRRVVSCPEDKVWLDVVNDILKGRRCCLNWDVTFERTTPVCGSVR